MKKKAAATAAVPFMPFSIPIHSPAALVEFNQLLAMLQEKGGLAATPIVHYWMNKVGGLMVEAQKGAQAAMAAAQQAARTPRRKGK